MSLEVLKDYFIDLLLFAVMFIGTLGVLAIVFVICFYLPISYLERRGKK